jgi:immunity protein, SdpI family
MNLRPFAIVAAVAVAIMIGLSAWAWGQVPDDAQIPIHWALDGTPNGYASKTFALLFLPALGAGLGALLYFLPRFEPRAQNLARSGSAYVQVCSGVMVVLVVTQLAIVRAAVGQPLPINLVVGLAVGGLFVVLGNVLGKVRSNFIFGVRTPWTLTSDLAWNRTHRLVGRLFVILGLAVLASALIGGEAMLALILGGVVVIVVVAFGYSYRVWKADPDKQTTGRQPAA